MAIAPNRPANPDACRLPGPLCEARDLIYNLTSLAIFLNFDRSGLTIGKVCLQRLQTR
jgi:hypothetical protein